jgi:alpha-galactosidase
MLMTGGQGCAGQTPDQALHCPGQTDNEYRSEFSFYAIVSSPLLIGTDVRNMTAIMNQLILNPEVLAINQDSSTPGDVTLVCGKTKILARHLSNGKVAVVATNWNEEDGTVSICFSDLGLGNGKVLVRDAWNQRDVGQFSDNYSRKLGKHDSMFLVLSKATK